MLKPIPLNPPIVNSIRKAIANIIDVVSRIFPPYIVPIQLKIFIPVGMPINILAAAKKLFTVFPSPVANMWCTHTPNASNPIATVDAATNT